MSSLTVENGLQTFYDNQGNPLNYGFVYVGPVNVDPVTNPANVYWDFAQTIPAQQPIRTINGRPVRNGSPSNFYVDGDYSITIKDSKNSFLYYSPNSNSMWANLASVDQTKGAAMVGYNSGHSVREQLDILSGAFVFATDKQFSGGAKGDGFTDDLAALNSWASYCYNNGKSAYLPDGSYSVSDTFEFPHNVMLRGAGPKRSKIVPHSSFTPSSPTWLMKVLQNPGAPAADNNFFCDWSGFGIYANHVSNLGCLSFAAGGGSRLADMYIVDGGSGVDQVSITPVVADGSGALVAQTFRNVWFGTTTFSPTCKNGVVVDNSYSLHFDTCIFDYLAINAPVGADGYAIKLLNSVGTVFTSINAEGNSAPFYINNSSNIQLVGGAIYRKGLGLSPSTDADFCFTVASNENEMPNIIGTRIFQGYGLSGGSGGIAHTISGSVLSVSISTNGELNYFNTRATQFNGGAQFGNTARTGSNLLDWYEEKDFSTDITVAGSTTSGTVNVTLKVGKATRIGNKVFANINVAYDSLTGAGGDLVVKGLPWSAVSTSGYRAYATIRASDLTYSNDLIAYVAAGESQIRLYQMASGTTNTAVSLDAAATLALSLVYDV